MPEQKEKLSFRESRGVLVRLWKYLYRFKGLLLTALLMTMISNMLALAGPLFAGYAVDAIGAGPGKVIFAEVFKNVFIMLIFYAISSLTSYLLSLVMIRLSQKTIYAMRRDVFNHLADLPVGYFDRTKTGDIVSRLSYDIDTVNGSLSTDLVQICTSAITVTGSFAMMLKLSPKLVPVFFLTIPISVLYTRHMSHKVRPLFRKRSEKLGELNGYCEEMTSGLKTIRAYHQEQTMTGRFDVHNTAAADAQYTAEYHGSVTGPTVNFVNNLSLSLVSVFGAILYLYGGLSIGSLSSFVLYSRKFSGPINEMANIFSELQSSCAAAERVFRLLDEEPEKADAAGAQELCEVRGHVTADDVSFGYTPDRTVLHHLSFDAAPGSLTAVVGPTGAGKTTIINLLMRFYDPDTGRIEVDSREIRGLTRRSLRSAYTMVLQETWLFSGTILENITYGSEGATREQAERAAKAAKIHDYIMQLPEGYDTMLDEDGINISKGQKQMLTIARAMLLESKMLILDEATSNVDTRTEKQIQEAMRSLMQGRTCFVIAHRLSTIQNADNILVVRDGNVVEQGTHASLLAKKGAYYELYHAQFE